MTGIAAPLDEKSIEALAKLYWRDRSRMLSHPVQTWEETREDNREFCRDYVVENWGPVIECYEAAHGEQSGRFDEFKCPYCKMGLKGDCGYHCDTPQAGGVPDVAVNDLADQIILACLTGVSKGDLKADLVKWLRPYLRTTEPVVVEGEMDARDWPEDFLHENGNYQNLCCECGKLFFGHKRRVVCRSCVKQKEALAKEQSDEMPDEVIREACIEYMRVTHPDWDPDHAFIEGQGANWKLYADGIRATFAVFQKLKQPAREVVEEDYIKVLEDSCWDLRCVDVQSGFDDSDIEWQIVGHWISKPQERVIGRGSNAVAAIKDAMQPRDYEGNLLNEIEGGQS